MPLPPYLSALYVSTKGHLSALYVSTKGHLLGRMAILTVVGISLSLVAIALGGGIVFATQAKNWLGVVILAGLLIWLLIYVLPELHVRGDTFLIHKPDLEITAVRCINTKRSNSAFA